MMEELNKLNSSIDNKLNPKRIETDAEIIAFRKEIFQIELKILKYFINNRVNVMGDFGRLRNILNYMRTKVNRNSLDSETRVKKLVKFWEEICSQ